MENLKDIIKTKGLERETAKQNRIDNYLKESDELQTQIIETYGKRVSKALKVIKTIKTYDPELWKLICYEKFQFDTYAYKNPTYFFTNGINHCLGFTRDLGSIGNEGGGACGNIDFLVTETSCTFDKTNTDNAWSRDCAKRFLKNFDAFETRFKDFVNKHYGDNVYDTYEV